MFKTEDTPDFEGVLYLVAVNNSCLNSIGIIDLHVGHVVLCNKVKHGTLHIVQSTNVNHTLEEVFEGIFQRSLLSSSPTRCRGGTHI